MDVFEVIADEFRDLPDLGEFVRIAFRLLAAIVLGGLVGLERETAGKAAGLRTHMLISMGAALVMIVAARLGMAAGDQSRVMQGLVAGIGFLGGGAILKLTDERRIKGLTTAAGIWMTASIGIAVGAGKMATAVVATALTFIVLRLLHALETRIFEAPREDA
jgi:putative Mg2+ transporter-C (MgtC) family protein